MTTSPPPPTMPLRVTRNDKIADGIHLFEFRDPAGNSCRNSRGARTLPCACRTVCCANIRCATIPPSATVTRSRSNARVTGRGGSINLIDDVKAGDELIVTAPVNDFGVAATRAGFPVHRRRHRRDADDGDDPAGDGGGQTLPPVLLLAVSGDDGLPRGTGAPAIQGHGHHPLRRGRRRRARSTCARFWPNGKTASISTAAGRAR